MKGQPTLFAGETRCFYGCGHTTFDRLDHSGRSPEMEAHYKEAHPVTDLRRRQRYVP